MAERPPFIVGKIRNNEGQKRRTMSNTPLKNRSFPRGSESSESSPGGKRSEKFIKPLPGGKIIAGSRALPVEDYLSSRSNRGLRASSDPNQPPYKSLESS